MDPQDRIQIGVVGKPHGVRGGFYMDGSVDSPALVAGLKLHIGDATFTLASRGGTDKRGGRDKRTSRSSDDRNPTRSGIQYPPRKTVRRGEPVEATPRMLEPVTTISPTLVLSDAACWAWAADAKAAVAVTIASADARRTSLWLSLVMGRPP